MTIARHYIMIARDDSVDALHAALVVLAGAVKPLDGCEGIAMFQDVETPTRFTFIEYWQSIEAHKAGGKMISKEVFGPMMAALAGSPEGVYLEQIPL